MLLNLVKNGVISKRTLLIQYYAKIDLNENQLAIILLIMELSSFDKKFFTPSQLSSFMKISKEKIENEISDLITKNLIILDMKAKHNQMNFTPLFNKILVLIENETFVNDKNDPISFIETYFSTTLSNTEKVSINSYLDKGISKPKLLEIVTVNEIADVKELIKLLNYEIKNEKITISKYNWLND